MNLSQAYLNEAYEMLRNPVMPNVYFILAADIFEENNLVKIGVSVDPMKRFDDLSLELWKEANSYPDWLNDGGVQLEMLGYVQGHQQLETALHKAFKDKHRGREWFTYDDELEADIGSILDDYCVCKKCLWADMYSGSTVPMPDSLKGIGVKLIVPN